MVGGWLQRVLYFVFYLPAQGFIRLAYQYALYLFMAAFLVAISGIFLAGKPLPDGGPKA